MATGYAISATKNSAPSASSPVAEPSPAADVTPSIAMTGAAPTATDGDLVLRRMRVADQDVVYLRAILEAYDGLGLLHGDGSGVIVVSAPTGLGDELDGVLAALQREAVIDLLP